MFLRSIFLVILLIFTFANAETFANKCQMKNNKHPNEIFLILGSNIPRIWVQRLEMIQHIQKNNGNPTIWISANQKEISQWKQYKFNHNLNNVTVIPLFSKNTAENIICSLSHWKEHTFDAKMPIWNIVSHDFHMNRLHHILQRVKSFLQPGMVFYHQSVSVINDISEHDLKWITLHEKEVLKNVEIDVQNALRETKCGKMLYN